MFFTLKLSSQLVLALWLLFGMFLITKHIKSNQIRKEKREEDKEQRK